VFLVCTKRRDAHALGVFVFKLLGCGALFSVLSLSACDDGKKDGPKPTAGVQYGDPVGIELGAHGTVPALAIKVAVTKGRDPAPSVGSLATAVYAAAVGCPAFVSAISAGKTTRIQLSARNGAFVPLGAAADEVGTACMANAFGGKPANMDQPTPLDIILELRLGSTDASH